MRCCFGAEDRQTSIELDQQIKVDRKKYQLKFLLLGSGDTGKSTFAKQMKILYGGGFEEKDLQLFTNIIKARIVVVLQNLVSGAEEIGVRIGKDAKPAAEEIMAANHLNPALLPHVKKTLADRGIKKALGRGDELQLDSNLDYYLEHLDRFAQDEFSPTTEDILKIRQKTSGVIETQFQIDGLDIVLIDVGGQRSERRKWLGCFENVDAIFFFVSLSEYNQNLSEDHRVNRLKESLELFEDVASAEILRKVEFFVFFNKEDLFRAKIQANPLSALFENFEGPDTPENSLKFISKLFEDRFGGAKPRPPDQFHSFITCSLNTATLRKALEEVRAIMEKNTCNFAVV